MFFYDYRLMFESVHADAVAMMKFSFEGDAAELDALRRALASPTMEELMASTYSDIQAAVADLSTALSNATDRVVAKIAELGEPDPDTTAEVQALRGAVDQLNTLAAEPQAPADEEPVVEEPVVEEPTADTPDGTV